MITEAILSLFMGIIDFLFGFIPDLDWSVADSVLNPFFDILDGVTYFLPMKTVGQIMALIIAINMFRVGVSLVKTILKFIPKL